MADNSIKRDPNLLYNNIEEQRLLYNNQLSLQDWNRIINELKTQANVNTKYLEQFIEWFMHGDAKYLELPTDESFVDYILDLLNYINSNYFHPDSTVEGGVVQAASCETVELLRHEMEYSIGDTIPIVTSENYQGPRDNDIPTTQLMRNLIDNAVEDSIVVRNLGIIEESPENAENTILNEINKAGIYTFTYNGNTYLMLVNKRDNNLKQIVIGIEMQDIDIKYWIRHPYYDTFTVTAFKTTDKHYVEEEFIKVRNFVNDKFSNLIGGENINEMYDTIKEIAEALASNKEVDEAINNALVNKANKSDIPTKLSQLQNDSVFITKTYADTKVPIINTLDGVRQPNIAGKTNWNLWDIFVFTYSPNARDGSGNLVYGGVPKLMKVSQGWNPDAANSTEGLTIVQRTKTGTITTANPIGPNDVVPLEYLKNYVEQNAGGVDEEDLDQYLVDKGLYTYRENYVEYESYTENYPDADGWYWGTTKTYNLFIGDATDSTIRIITKDPDYANEKYIIDYNNETGVLTVKGATRLPYNLHTHLTIYYERGTLSDVIENTESKLKTYVSNYAYSKSAVDNKLSAIPKFAIEVVNDIHKLYNPSTTTVYLVPKENETNDLYEEWIYINDTWELLGTAKVDLTDYAKIEQIPTKLSQLEQDIELGVSEEQVMEIIEENSEQVGEYNIGPSDGYDWNSDTEIPTCKAVTEMINNDKRMQEMIVDIVWDENDEAFIELGKNIIDWSRPVFFELYIQNGKDSFVLEWNIYEKVIRYYPFSFTISKDDYSLIVNGWGFYSSGSKSRIDSHLEDIHIPSYIYLCDTGDVQYILNYNKMKVYYYPVNENSPTVYAEV